MTDVPKPTQEEREHAARCKAEATAAKLRGLREFGQALKARQEAEKAAKKQ